MRAVKVTLEEAIRIAQLPMVTVSPRQESACFLPDDWRSAHKCDPLGFCCGASQAIGYRGEIAIFDYESHSIVGAGELKYILHSSDASDKDRPPIWEKLGRHAMTTYACTWFFSSLKKLKVVTRVVSPKLSRLKWKSHPLIWNLPCPNTWADLIAKESLGECGDSEHELSGATSR